jgi:twitching motility two-component system response regulator PilG
MDRRAAAMRRWRLETKAQDVTSKQGAHGVSWHRDGFALWKAFRVRLQGDGSQGDRFKIERDGRHSGVWCGIHVAWSLNASRRGGTLTVNENVNHDGLAGLKVMVIDDSKTIRRTAETLLKKEGAEVLTAVDGFEALAKISDLRPDIIFVDIMMPRLDGYQTCALIKNNHVFRSTPVIMLSSKDGLFDKARGRIVGSEQYLTKPFTRDELLDAIRQHVAADK